MSMKPDFHDAMKLLHAAELDDVPRARETLESAIEGLRLIASGNGLPPSIDPVQEAALMGAATIAARTLHGVRQDLIEHGADAFMIAQPTVAWLVDGFVAIVAATSEAKLPEAHQIAAPEASRPTLH